MKNIFKIASLFLSVALTFAGCSKEDGPFDGHDAHIVSFSLTVDGVKYPAAISGNDITVSIPTSVDLKNATVEYALCENAKIQPDPATIDNWNEEQLFRIQAWNSDYTSYRYVINRTNVTNGDDIMLSTQSEVEKFAARHINSVTGNLIIGSAAVSADPVSDLSALYELTEVKYNVVINNSFTGTSLSGLHNLKRAGGVYVGTETIRATPQKRISIELPALEQTSNIVINSDSVTVVSFAKLKSAGNFYVNSIQLRQIDIASLTECTGSLTIKGQNGGGAETESNLVLATLQMPALKNIDGNLLIENLWAVSPLTLSALETVGGDLNIKYVRTAKSISIPWLTSVGGALNIQANDGMTKFYAPELESAASLNIASVNSYSLNLKSIDIKSLKSVTGNFTVQYFGSTALSFPSLTTVGGTLNLSQMQFLETVDVPVLASCPTITLSTDPMLGSINMSKVTDLTTLTLSACPRLTEFKSPEEISGNVTVSGTNMINDNTPFVGLKKIGGKLTMTAYATSKDLVISGLESIGSYAQSSGTTLTSLSFPDLLSVGDFTLSGMTKMTTLSAPKLTQTGNLSIKGLLALTTIDFAKLTTVNGTLTFYGGSYSSQASQSQTTNLNGFSAITSVTKVDIRYAGKLADFSGLKNLIPNLASTAWTVQGCLYNPTYQNMLDGKYTNE